MPVVVVLREEQHQVRPEQPREAPVRGLCVLVCTCVFFSVGGWISGCPCVRLVCVSLSRLHSYTHPSIHFFITHTPTLIGGNGGANSGGIRIRMPTNAGGVPRYAMETQVRSAVMSRMGSGVCSWIICRNGWKTSTRTLLHGGLVWFVSCWG